jgi:hypothetical protein
VADSALLLHHILKSSSGRTREYRAADIDLEASSLPANHFAINACVTQESSSASARNRMHRTDGVGLSRIDVAENGHDHDGTGHHYKAADQRQSDDVGVIRLRRENEGGERQREQMIEATPLKEAQTRYLKAAINRI